MPELVGEHERSAKSVYERVSPVYKTNTGCYVVLRSTDSPDSLPCRDCNLSKGLDDISLKKIRKRWKGKQLYVSFGVCRVCMNARSRVKWRRLRDAGGARYKEERKKKIAKHGLPKTNNGTCTKCGKVGKFIARSYTCDSCTVNWIISLRQKKKG